MHFNNPYISNRQKGFIIGTILGGSSIICPNNGKSCYLSMRSKDAYWLEFKGDELKNLASDKPYTIEKTTNRWHSLCYPVFKEYYNIFYKNGKRHLKKESIELLTDIAWMVWFGDVGKIIKKKVVLNTNIWKEEGTQIIVDCFREIDYNADVINKNNKFKIKLDEKSSLDFLDIIKPHLPIWKKQ